MTTHRSRLTAILLALTSIGGLLMGGCTPRADTATAGGPATGQGSALSGEITIDGSSTVFPIMEKLAELFGEKHQGRVRITVGTSGTGGGFKKFANNEIMIANASRPIEQEEIAKATAAGVEFVELPIAFDGLSVVINPENTWAQTLTVAELRKIWQPNSTVKMWSDVRPGFPRQKINLFGPGTDSGTFDYFTKAINGEEKASRPDFMASEDDNVLVMGVAGDRYALGYFGFAYYEQNRDKLTTVAIDNGKGGVKPTFESIADGTYQPLSRPLMIYVTTKALEQPQVVAFLEFILTEGYKSIREVGFIPLPDELYPLIGERLEKRVTGSVFSGADVGVKIQDLIRLEGGQAPGGTAGTPGAAGGQTPPTTTTGG